jgi:hypothetical protein
MRSGSETRKRTKLLPPVRCTEAELAAVTVAANDAGKTVSQLVRDSLLEAPAPGPRPRRRRPTHDVVELARISGLLGKYGSNVNQLAHVANSDGDRITEHELLELAADIREIKLLVLKVLGYGD